MDDIWEKAVRYKPDELCTFTSPELTIKKTKEEEEEEEKKRNVFNMIPKNNNIPH